MSDRNQDATSVPSASRGIIGTYHNDLRTELVFASEGLARCFNVPPDMARKGLPLRAYLDAVLFEDRNLLEVAVWNARAEGSLCATYRVATPEHGVRHVLDVGVCFVDRDNAPLAISGYLVDVSETATGSSDATGSAQSRLIAHLEAASADAHVLHLDVAAYLIEITLNEVEKPKRR